MQKRRRVSDTVLTGVLPALGLKHHQAGIHTRGGHLGSGSTLTTPNPWAVINFEIFWVMLSPKGSCGERANRICGAGGEGGCCSSSGGGGCCSPGIATGGGCCSPGGGGRGGCCCSSGGGQSCCSSSRPLPSCTSSFSCNACPRAGECPETQSAISLSSSSSSMATAPDSEGQADAPGFCGLANERASAVDATTHHRHHHQFGSACTRCHTSVPPDAQCQGAAPVCHCSSAKQSSAVRKLSRDSGVGEERDDGPPHLPEVKRDLQGSHEVTREPGSRGQGPAAPATTSACCCHHVCRCCRSRSLACSAAHLPVEALKEEARQLRAGDVTHREGSQVKGATMRVAGEGFSAHKSAVSEQQQRQTKTPAGTINQESSRQAASSGITITAKGVCTKQTSSMTSSQSNVSITGFEDLDLLNDLSQPVDIQNAIMRYSGVMSNFVEQLKTMTFSEGFKDAPSLLDNIDEMIRKAWSVPTHGHELGFSLCNVLRNNGGIDVLLKNCTSDDLDLKFSSAKVLEQCLTTENRGYVVENGLEDVVNVACDCTKNGTSVDKSRVGTGILEHLFKHSEGTCSEIINLGGLDAVLSECRKSDVETLRHCAGALANLSLYGGSDNQQQMIRRNVPMWLFPLAFHTDDNIKYYACLAIATLVANKELEAAVLQSGTLDLVEPFVTNQIPDQFANSTVAHRHGQSSSWLKRLVPVLSSKREEARNLAAFHFCMEAGIKQRQGNLELFREIGAVEPLKEVASSPNAIASKYAVKALKLIGEEVPHILSQQVPLWTPEDVQNWVKRIGFSDFADDFVHSRVDGDLLLQLTEQNLCEDIGMKNGILRQRFLRELKKLKLMADFSSCDSTKLNEFMQQVDPDFAVYTYNMLNAGVTRDSLRNLSEEQLFEECRIFNSIHRQKVKEKIREYYTVGQISNGDPVDKNLDVFISYRRSNGSQLASLLKVHMQLKDFSVFIDVERLEAGKFDNNLLNSIRQAKNFLLVLTPNALDRCIGDTECKDWVHREIVAALQSGCNIIPILDNFQWPDPEELPEDMRAVCYFNGVRWIHDYQDACVEKIERFIRGECNMSADGPLARYVSGSALGGMATPGTPSTLPRAPPLYQRTTSTESGKGSSCSDKDFAKD